MPNAIPIGRKTPILPLITPTIMRSSPLIAKSVEAVLYDFKFLDDLLSIMKVYILYWAITSSLFHVPLIVNIATSLQNVDLGALSIWVKQAKTVSRI